MADLADRLIPVATTLLSPGETLTGCCVATWQKTFSGRMVAIAVAPDRIIVQALTRRFEPDGDPIPLPRERLRRVAVSNGIGGSVTMPSLLMETVSISVDLTTTDALRLRLMLMGSGGQVQHDGIAALLAYLQPLLEPSS
jgi:hypothetical protein